MRSIMFSLFFLSPVSLFQDVSVPIFGKEHHFPRVIYQRIVPATPDQAGEITTLSEYMPLMYQAKLGKGSFSFRQMEVYERLLKGEDIKSKARNKDNFFFVFIDPEGDIQGYIHGSTYQDFQTAKVDELVVNPAWRKKGVAQCLMGRLLFEFSRQGRVAVNVMSRVPISKNLVEPYGIQPRNTGFDLSLVMDHLLSRFSLSYLMDRTAKDDSLYAEVAEELKAVLREAKSKDHFKTEEALEYLAGLEKQIDIVIQAKFREEAEKVGENPTHQEEILFYYGIQIDKLEMANLYFLIYLLSVMSGEDPNNDQYMLDYFNSSELYFNFTLSELRLAQRQGGKLPADIQIVIARLHAFIRIFENLEKGSPEDVLWVRKSIREYLKLIDLKQIKGQQVIVFPALIETALREMLWFRYPYKQAARIADKMMKMRQAFVTSVRQGTLSLGQREGRAAALFESLRREVWQEQGIELEPEFGLMFLYCLPLYSSQEEGRHRLLGELFSKASFYVYDAKRKKWNADRERSLTELLEGNADFNLKKDESGEIPALSQMEAAVGLEGILQELEKPISKRMKALVFSVEPESSL